MNKIYSGHLYGELEDGKVLSVVDIVKQRDGVVKNQIYKGETDYGFDGSLLQF